MSKTVYPYGQQDASLATEVNKYYNYGVTTGSSTHQILIIFFHSMIICEESTLGSM